MTAPTYFEALAVLALSLLADEKPASDLFQIRRVAESSGPDTVEMKVVSNSDGEEIVNVEHAVLLNGSAIRWARARKERTNPNAVIEVIFTAEGQDQFAKITKSSIGSRIAMIVDGELHCAPIIREEITNGIAVISGTFSYLEARSIARQIIFGAYSLPKPSKSDDSLPSKDFTFVRIKYGAREGGDSWQTDFPDADLNFASVFGKVTGAKIHPQGKILTLTDPEIRDYPFIYIAEGGAMELASAEIIALRKYLKNGGFLMVDDFWGEEEWENVRTEMKRAFPDMDPVDLSLEHPVFHSFYDVQEKPQIPNIMLGIQSRFTGVTWERPDAKEAHYRGLIDANGRLLAIFCHNTDFGDGWERDCEDEYYFKEFSLKKAYPLGINIVIYALSQQ